MIGNTNCRFNELSPTLRCSVNPDGPCEGCVHFEAINLIDSKFRKLNMARKRLISTLFDPDLQIENIIICFVIVLIFSLLTVLVSHIDIPARYFPDYCAEFIIRHSSIPYLKSMIVAYMIMWLPCFILTLMRTFHEMNLNMHPPGTSIRTLVLLVLINEIIYTLMGFI